MFKTQSQFMNNLGDIVDQHTDYLNLNSEVKNGFSKLSFVDKDFNRNSEMAQTI